MTPRTLPYPMLTRKSVLGSACALLVACSSGGEPRPDDGIPSLGETRLQLERAQSCDELLTRIQDSTIAQLALRAEQLKQGEDSYYGYDLGGEVIVDEDAEAPRDPATDGGTPSGAPAPVPTGSGNGAAPPQGPTVPGSVGEGDAPEEGGGFSGTTVQVKDVDEADIVKTDGDRIYLLHGGTLFVLRGWPANATEIIGSTLVDGLPAEMFVSNGKAVVFSRVYEDVAGDASADSYYYYDAGYTKISVFDVSEATPRVLRESFVEGEYSSSRRHGDVVRAVIQDGFKIPRLDSPAIEYRDAFGQPYPQQDIDAQVDAWLARTTRSIRATDLGDWLPRELNQQGDDIVPVAPRCADYYSPDPGLTENGVTSVVAFDLADVAAPLSGATILGRAERVYANDEALLITQTDYRFTYDEDATEQTVIHRFDLGDGAQTAYRASGAVPGRINSQFSLDERDGIIRVSTTIQPSWRAGGGGDPVVDLPTAPPPATVTPTPAATPGGAAPNTSESDPADGSSSSDSAAAADPVEDKAAAPPADPAIATDPVPPDQPSSVAVSRVITLVPNDDTLVELGSSEDFGQNEQIYATRFIGDRAYVVTFRRTDPLFVLDLSDPVEPHIVGELHIPGFSNYLFPLDDNHMFAIGQDATSDGVVQGLALQIFDVTDPTQPTLAAKHVYAGHGDSPANIDHRAITFHPERNVIALPHQSYETGESTLDLFELRFDAIEPVGSVNVSDQVDIDQCLANYYGPLPEAELAGLKEQLAGDPLWQREILASCRYGYQFRRGLFRDDFVYGISTTGVYVYDMTQMAAGAVSTLALPAQVYANNGYGEPTLDPRPLPGDIPPSMGGGSSPGSGPSQGTGGASGSEDLPAPDEASDGDGASAGGSPGSE